MTNQSNPSLSNEQSLFFDEISNSTCGTELVATIYESFKSLGVTKICYIHLPHIGALDHDEHYLATYPEPEGSKINEANLEWLHSILHKVRLIDEPLLVKQLLESLDVVPPQEDGLLYTKLANNLNTIVIPLHSANGRSACMLVQFGDKLKEHSVDEIRAFAWAADLTHKQFCKFKKSSEAPARKLTEREDEIIKWVARGKSNSVIADIVGISQHTVNGYIRSIYLKTGTSDRTGATLRCIGEGLSDI